MFPRRSQSMASASASPGITTMEGVLEKKKKFGSSRLHCELRDGKLWYSEDKGRESLIDISHAQSVREGKGKFSFEIITSSRTHVFVAESKASQDAWIKGLREAMRVSSRKMSAISYLEADEDSLSVGPRSSVAVKPSAVALKPGATSTLPASLTTRTPVKSFAKDGIPELSKSSIRVSDATSILENSVSATEGSTNKGSSSAAETGETDARPVKLRREKENATDIKSIKDSISEINVEPKSYTDDDDNDGNKSESSYTNDYESVIHLNNDFQVKEFCATFHDDSGNDQDRCHPTIKEDEKAIEAQLRQDDYTDYTSSTSLYANNADIKKFLSEQKTESDGVRFSSADICRSENSPQSELLTANSSEIKPASELQNSESVEENSDEVFPLISESSKTVKPSPPAVVPRRSRSGSSDSFRVDSVAPELVEVELDVDFVPTPIPNLPHPRLESNRSSAFVDIRTFLSDKMTDESFRSTVQPGSAIESLKRFLGSMGRV